MRLEAGLIDVIQGPQFDGEVDVIEKSAYDKAVKALKQYQPEGEFWMYRSNDFGTKALETLKELGETDILIKTKGIINDTDKSK